MANKVLADWYVCKAEDKAGLCEDYAITGVNGDGINYAIICDGCSSANATDVGARLLARSVVKYLKLTDTRDIARFAARDAYALALSIGLGADSLSATLGIVRSDDNKVEASLCGDGMIIFMLKDGSTVITTIDYKRNAPEYPIYLISKAMGDSFTQLTNNEKTLTTTVIAPDGSVDETEAINPSQTIVISADISNVKRVLVCSDGMASYVPRDKYGTKEQNNNRGSYISIYKTVLKGAKDKGFVSDGFNKAESLLDSFVQTDDVSMAGLLFGD